MHADLVPQKEERKHIVHQADTQSPPQEQADAGADVAANKEIRHRRYGNEGGANNRY